jgi:LuxR family transcriptional regulator, maltose regulon positive regulatory protein
MAISHRGVITRRRLLHLAGGAAAPITLVSAPAGYGKTTLLRQWTTETGPVIHLDPAENPDHWQLWQQVSEALSLSVVTVIIDDLHLMEHARGSGPLRDALRRASASRRLVIATRSDPILALHEARLDGKVREIRADELAFDEDETRRFLAANDIAVSAEQAYALWVHTEGWPAGLRLSTTPLSRAPRTDEAFSTLLQGDTAVGSYLMGQALAYTPDDLREFLLQTSVSEFLDAELAEKLTGRSDSALLLERARVQPGFLNRPSEGRWPYRYHPMFRALLLAELMGVASGEVRRLSALAAEWFASHGEHARAAPLAVQGQSWEVLAESILAGSCVALATGDGSWVRHALARLPASHLEANLGVQLASILLMVGTGARRQAAAAAAAIAEREYPAATRLETQVITFVKAWLAAERGDTRTAAYLLEAGPDGELAHGSAAALRGLRTTWQQVHAVCLFVDGADSRTVDAMLSESHSSSGDSYPAIQLGDREIQAWAAIAAGDLRSARQHLNRAAAMLDREGARGVLDHSGTTSLAWRWLEMETGEHGSAPPDHGGDRHVRSAFPQPISEALTTITDARLRLTRDSDCLGSAVLLDDLVAAHPQIQHWPTIRSLWAITRIETHVESGEFSRALDLTLNPSNGVHDGARNQSYQWAWVMQRAALHPPAGVLDMDPEWLISNLPLESALLRGRSEALRVRVLLGAASLALRAEMPERASHYLRLALQSTEAHWWRRPYVEIAAAITPVLEAERRRITSRSEQVIGLLSYLRQQPAYGGQLPDPLSVRELEILQYLPTPLDQRELCSALFISRNTLKTHLRSTYRKLGVQTRREAVLRAERLGIL